MMANPKRYSEKVSRKDDEKKSGMQIPSGSYNMMDSLSIIKPLFEPHFKSIHSRGGEIRAKLEISQSQDHSEMQADEMAESFMSGDTEHSQDIISQHTPEVSRKGEGGGMETSNEFDQQLESTKGQGQKIDAGTKSELEEHTGTDLSGVNVHTNSQAHNMSESINAKAFTHGQDIYFKGGNYNPQSEEGKSLLAHEVAHTVQQGSNIQTKQIQRKIDLTEHGFTKKQEAYLISHSVDVENIPEDDLKILADLMNQMYLAYQKNQGQLFPYFDADGNAIFDPTYFFDYEDLPNDQGEKFTISKGENSFDIVITNNIEFSSQKIEFNIKIGSDKISTISQGPRRQFFTTVEEPVIVADSFPEAWKEAKKYIPVNKGKIFHWNGKAYIFNEAPPHPLSTLKKAEGDNIHTIKKGETPKTIADKYKETEEDLLNYNGYEIKIIDGKSIIIDLVNDSPKVFKAGDTLVIPPRLRLMNEEDYEEFEPVLVPDTIVNAILQIDNYIPPAFSSEELDLIKKLNGESYLFYLVQQLNEANNMIAGAEDPSVIRSALEYKNAPEKALASGLKFIALIANELERLGYGSTDTYEGYKKAIDKFYKETDDFLEAFKNKAYETALAMLTTNRYLLISEAERYGVLDKENEVTPDLRILEEAAAKLQDALDLKKKNDKEADELVKEVVGQFGETAILALTGFGQNKLNRAKQLKEQGDNKLKQVKSEVYPICPILADDELSISILANSTSTEAIIEELNRTIISRLAKIDDAETEVRSYNDDRDFIWRVPEIIQETKKQLGIESGSVCDQAIANMINYVKATDFDNMLFLGAISVVLGILSYGAGFSLLGVGAGIGGFAISAYQAYVSYEKYSLQSNLYEASLETGKTLTAQEPSLFWLAMDIAFAVVDLTGALRAFNGLRKSAQALMKGTETFASYKNAVKTTADDLLGQGILKNKEELEQFVQRLTDKYDPAYSNNLKKLQADEKIRAALIGDEANLTKIQELRTKYPEIDDVELAGHLKIGKDAELLVKLTKIFGEGNELLRSVMTLAGRGDDYVKAIKKLSLGLDEKEFGDIITHYASMRSPAGPNILEAMEKAGVSVGDIRDISFAMIRLRTAGGRITRFTKMLNQKIALRMGGGSKGYAKMLELTSDLHPSQSGSIFENWVRTYVPGLKRPTKPIVLNGKKFYPDLYYELNGEIVIVDLKHYGPTQKLTGHAEEQILNYQKIIKAGAKIDGKPITKIEYMFSMKEAATTNKKMLEDVLGDELRMSYFSDQGILTPFK